jgi:hypothetical protein
MLFLYLHSKKDMVEEYGQNFRSLWDTVEAFGGSPGIHKGLTDSILETVVGTGGTAMTAQIKAAKEQSSKAVKAAFLISGADRHQYGNLKDQLANNYLLGTNQYPNMLDKALHILGNYQTTRVAGGFKAYPNDTGVAFLQQGGQGGRGAGQGGQGGQGDKSEGSRGTANAGGDDVSTLTGRMGAGEGLCMNSMGEPHCFHCGSPSHWAYECPQLSAEQQAQLHMNVGAQEGKEQEQVEEAHQMLHVSLAQGGELPDDRVYLDGCSTVTAFKSDKYLQGIRTVQGGIKINCNAGAVVTNKRGTYGNLKVWYLPDGIANIFLVHELEKLYRITYNSWQGYYGVHTPKGEVRFHKDKQGLPYIDLKESSQEAAMMLLQHKGKTYEAGENEVLKVGTSFVQTVHGKYKRHTKREILKAKEARRAQAMLGNPSEKDYQGMVRSNLIANCPFSLSDVTNAQAIFGPDLVIVRGKTVRQTPTPVVGDYVAVPCSLVDANKVITLAADVFFVDGTPFLLMVSRRIKFVTAEHVPVRTATSLSKHITQVLEVYGRAGFRVRTILMDGKFEKLKSILSNVECNTTAAKELVSEAERMIWMVKERTRGLLATLPFLKIPRRMIIKFVYFMVLWINAFPVKTGISTQCSPWEELLVWWRLDYKKHCWVPPGTYCEVHDEPVPMNTMTWCTHKCIALGPTGNLQGSVKIYCLNTGRVLKHRSFTPMPMPN